jgi:Ca2+-binding EF-hand superfamily protein
LIDTDDSGTISKDELVKALAKFNIGIPEREIKMLV